MAAALASALYGDADQWEDPTPNHTNWLGIVGSGAATNAADTRRHFAAMSIRSPLVLAFTAPGDTDHIYVGHSASLYPGNPTNACALDDKLVVLVGNDLNAAVPYVFDDPSFQRTNNIRCFTREYMVGANGHGAAAPVFRFALAGADAAANANELRVRKVFALPPSQAATFLNTNTDGQYSRLGFYNNFVRPGLEDGDAAVVTATEPLRDWWRVCCTNTPGNAPQTDVTVVAVNTPGLNQRLTAWVSRIRRQQLSRLGHGGPGLNQASFEAGITTLRNTMNQNAAARLDFERERNERSFTEKHGADLADRMHRFCGVVTDDALPHVHRLLAKSTLKSRDYAIVQSQFQIRVAASPLPVSHLTQPLATPKLVEKVFRSCEPAGTGLQFAMGLSPFAIVCEGQAEADKVKRMLEKAKMVESGSTLSLADADSITNLDTRLASESYIARNQCYGWSIGVDVFHGATTDIATNVRNLVSTVAPAFDTIVANAPTKAIGMDTVHRIMFHSQQYYFAWCRARSRAENPTVPSFADIVQAVDLGLYGNLSPLPNSWYTLSGLPVGGPTEQARPPAGGSSGGAAQSLRQRAGLVTHFNAHADRALLTRFRDSGHTSIAQMMEGHDCTVPHHGEAEVCLAWALKGQCSQSCRRAAQHVRYGAATIHNLHQLLTDYRVANPQG